MSDIVIQAENLGKKYTIGHQAENGRYVAMRDVLVNNACTTSTLRASRSKQTWNVVKSGVGRKLQSTYGESSNLQKNRGLYK